MKKLTVSFLAAAALMAPVLANARLVTLVDSFDVGPQRVFDTSTAAGVSTNVALAYVNPPTNTVFGRTVTHELLEGSNSTGGGSNVTAAHESAPGTLYVSNRFSRRARVTLDWTLPAGFIPNAMDFSPASVVFDLLFSDLDVVADLYLNGVALRSRTLTAYDGISGPVLAPRATYFDLTSAQQNSIAGSGSKVLTLVLNGPVDWDLQLDNLRFEIPEPSSLPLAALALAGAAAALRRRKTAPTLC